INSCGYNANSICAVTFTNKAANEMRARVSAFLPALSRRGLKVATFHTLGLSIIKRDVSRCDLKPGFSIFDSEDCLQILRGFLPVNKATDRDFILKVQQQISLWKNNLLNPELILQNPPQTLLCDEALTIYPRYQEALKAY
ncbi:ATP-dependent DNA helicase Rep, partial [Pseudomonas syringae pv. pisi]